MLGALAINNPAAMVGGGGIPFFLNLTPATTSKLKAGYAAMKAGTRNMILAVEGDSTDRGVDETASPYGSQYRLSIAEQLAILFRADGIAAGANNWYGISGTSLPDYDSRDDRFTASGTAAMGSSVVQGGAGLSMSSATAAMSFTPQGQWTKADIYTMQNSAFNGATLNANIDGGSNTAITQNATNTIRKTTLTAGALGTHTVNIAWGSGANALYGIDCYDDSRKEITIRNWAQSGGTASQMSDNTGTPTAGRVNQATLFQADCFFGGLGLVNSWRNGTAVATVKTQVETFIDNVVKANGADFIFTVPPIDSGSAGNTANQQQYIDAAIASVLQRGCAVFNLRAAPNWTSKALSDAAGFTSAADFVHKAIAGAANSALLLEPGLRYGMGLAPYGTGG